MQRLTEFVAALGLMSFAQWAVWGGMALTTVAAAVPLIRRRNTLSPLAKCTIVSVWFHVLLVVYATSVQIAGGGPGSGSGDDVITVRLTTAAPPAVAAPSKDEPSRERPAFDPTIPRPTFASLTKPQPSVAGAPGSHGAATLQSPQLNLPSSKLPVATARAAADDALVRWSTPAGPTTLPKIVSDPTAAVARLAAPVVNPAPKTPVADAPGSPIVNAPSPQVAAVVTPPPDTNLKPFELPSLYGQRLGDHERLAAARGGSAQTEGAVRAALRWLAANQDADGRWDADRFGAGRETQTLGHHRNGAGAKADTGITGLALLAFLGGGHTHQTGQYKTQVGRGLDFLIAAQHPDGNLGGDAEPYAFMYCHGMATLAMTEALAMTGDPRLKPYVEHALRYTLRAQNRTTGGWRYRPGDTGDTSQLGWQLMSLKSAELAGLNFPQPTRDGIDRFLQSVSSGNFGGLASYRPQEQVSRPMTAEALVCKQFLGLPRENPAGNEAGDFILGELPSADRANFYYWYYGTLAMYQLQGDHWRQWNEALTKELLRRQTTAGELAGSWEPNDVWGGYGGRVYSTSLAALCLEVYYRYLPLYVEAGRGRDTQRK